MKYILHHHSSLTIGLFALLILGTSSGIAAQEDVYIKVAKFSIVIETLGDEIKLTCNDGCAWKQLAFSAAQQSDAQAVDPYGMTRLTGERTKKDSLSADFLFTIKRTPEGVSLEGKRRTLWPSLTFNCGGGNCLRTIDAYGTTEPVKK